MYRLGSNVSVAAIPPAIHSTMTVSAVGRMAGGATSPYTLGARAARAASVAADAVLRKSRRVGDGINGLFNSYSDRTGKVARHLVCHLSSPAETPATSRSPTARRPRPRVS